MGEKKFIFIYLLQPNFSRYQITSVTKLKSKYIIDTNTYQLTSVDHKERKQFICKNFLYKNQTQTNRQLTLSQPFQSATFSTFHFIVNFCVEMFDALSLSLNQYIRALGAISDIL